jgi:hypothetical protein
MPSLDQIRQTAERISGNPDNGDIRTFINELMDALEPETADSIAVTEQREQQRLQ